METLQAIQTRKSIRVFQEKKIPVDIIKTVLQAATRAPSGCNRQPWRFIVVTDREKMKHFTSGKHYPFVENAPAIIVVCANPHDTYEAQDEEATDHILDTAAATQNILLAIHDLGLGAVWVTGFSRISVRKILNIPKHWQINSLIPFGYYTPNGTTEWQGHILKNNGTTPRKPLSEVAFFNSIDTPIQD
ncbi:MAG: nitroreductase family protein [Victivallales bacterium]